MNSSNESVKCSRSERWLDSGRLRVMRDDRFDWGTMLLATGIATLATTVVVSVLSKKETGSAASGLNATSHILWGEEAAQHDETDLLAISASPC